MSALLLLPLAIGLPVLLAGLSLLPAMRRRVLDLGVIAPLPALAACLIAPRGEPFVLPDLLLGMSLQLGETGAVFLAGAGLVWLAASVYARTALDDDERRAGFALFWNLAIAGNAAVILAADAASFYVGFTLVSLISWPLILHRRTDRARRAGHVYIALAIAGEVALLAGLVMGVAAAGGSLDIATIRAALPGASGSALILGLLVVAFGIKTALIPLHVWAPLAYRAAPVPAAAVLSGAIAKAGIVGLLAFMPLEAGPQFTGAWLAGLGFAGVFGAAIAGLTQTHPRTVLAYSSISQLGLMTATTGLALATGMGAHAVIAAVALYAFHHGLAKGALFLGSGAAARTGGPAFTRLRWGLGLAAFSIAGFPLTGGMIAKLALKHEMPPAFEYGVIVSAVTTTLVLLRFLDVLSPNGEAGARAPLTLSAPAVLLSAGAVLLPWLFLGLAPVSPAYAVDAGNLVHAVWPLAAAALIYRFGRALRGPAIPPGDILFTVLEGASALRSRVSWPAGPDGVRRAAASLASAARRVRAGPWLDRAEDGLRSGLPAVIVLGALAFAGLLLVLRLTQL